MSASPLVGIVMGSSSDLPVMQLAARALEELGVPWEMTVVSAHRTPERLYTYARDAEERGLRVLVAGAGGAAHLPGMLASSTVLPVVGVPIKGTKLDGWDALLSIVQMPSGVPVATVAVDGGTNAGLLAAQILGAGDPALRARLRAAKDALREKALGMAAEVEREAAALRAPGRSSGSAGPG